jgi:antitoxin YefM
VAKIVPFTEARANLTELLDDLEDRQEHVLITRNGRPSAVMLSADEYESLEETLDILQDKDLLEALRKSEDDVRAGRLTSLEDLRRTVILRAFWHLTCPRHQAQRQCVKETSPRSGGAQKEAAQWRTT